MSVTTDILRSYRAPRAVLRGLRGGARREARILVYLMVACLLIYVAQWPRLAREARIEDVVPLEMLMAGALFAWVFVAPLLFYALAGLLWLILRPVQRGIAAFDLRLALFWALLVASPLALLHGLTIGLVGVGPASALSFALTVAVFVVVLVAGVRVALEGARAAA